MLRELLYAGPGKMFMATTVLWPEGENGAIDLRIEQESDDVASGMHGRIDETQSDCLVKASITPFDNWGALALLFPAVVKTPVPGTRIHGAADVPCKIWTPDGRLYTILAAAVTKHPELHLGTGKALFGATEVTGVLANGKNYGDAASLLSMTLTAGADPGGEMTLADFVRGPWTGIWGTQAGFGGDLNGTPVEAEEEWTIATDVKYSPLKVQKLTRSFKLDSVKFMARVRPVGPTHQQLADALRIHGGGKLGERRGAAANAADLVLTGPNAKTITLKQAGLVGAGFEFGGTRLGTGEIGFVASMTFTAGATQPLIVFSA